MKHAKISGVFLVMLFVALVAIAAVPKDQSAANPGLTVSPTWVTANSVGNLDLTLTATKTYATAIQIYVEFPFKYDYARTDGSWNLVTWDPSLVTDVKVSTTTGVGLGAIEWSLDVDENNAIRIYSYRGITIGDVYTITLYGVKAPDVAHVATFKVEYGLKDFEPYAYSGMTPTASTVDMATIKVIKTQVPEIDAMVTGVIYYGYSLVTDKFTLGAVVEFRNAAGGLEGTTSSDSTGAYTMDGLAPSTAAGTYSVTAYRVGWATGGGVGPSDPVTFTASQGATHMLNVPVQVGASVSGKIAGFAFPAPDGTYGKVRVKVFQAGTTTLLGRTDVVVEGGTLPNGKDYTVANIKPNVNLDVKVVNLYYKYYRPTSPTSGATKGTWTEGVGQYNYQAQTKSVAMLSDRSTASGVNFELKQGIQITMNIYEDETDAPNLVTLLQSTGGNAAYHFIYVSVKDSAGTEVAAIRGRTVLTTGPTWTNFNEYETAGPPATPKVATLNGLGNGTYTVKVGNIYLKDSANSQSETMDYTGFQAQLVAKSVTQVCSGPAGTTYTLPEFELTQGGAVSGTISLMAGEIAANSGIRVSLMQGTTLVGYQDIAAPVTFSKVYGPITGLDPTKSYTLVAAPRKSSSGATYTVADTNYVTATSAAVTVSQGATMIMDFKDYNQGGGAIVTIEFPTETTYSGWVFMVPYGGKTTAAIARVRLDSAIGATTISIPLTGIPVPSDAGKYSIIVQFQNYAGTTQYITKTKVIGTAFASSGARGVVGFTGSSDRMRATAILTGTIRYADPNNPTVQNPLPWAKVEISASPTVVATAYTSGAGNYQVDDLTAGTYTITATKGGFVTPASVSVALDPASPGTTVPFTPTLGVVVPEFPVGTALTLLSALAVSVYLLRFKKPTQIS